MMYSWNLWQHLYFDGLVGGCRDGAGVREGSDRARPSSENMLNIYNIMIIPYTLPKAQRTRGLSAVMKVT